MWRGRLVKDVCNKDMSQLHTFQDTTLVQSQQQYRHGRCWLLEGGLIVTLLNLKTKQGIMFVTVCTL